MESKKGSFLTGFMVGILVTFLAFFIAYKLVMSDAVVIPKVMLDFLEGKTSHISN